MKNRPYSDDDLLAILQKREAGKTFQEIADGLGRTRNSIASTAQKLREDDEYFNGPVTSDGTGGGK